VSEVCYYNCEALADRTPSFLRWRVGLMEKSVQKLNLSSASKPIPNFGEGPDPYQGFQV